MMNEFSDIDGANTAASDGKYAALAPFFLWLAILSFVCACLQELVHNWIFKATSTVWYHELYYSFWECGLRVLFALPAFALILICRKKLRADKRGDLGRFFSNFSFVYVAGGIVFPFAAAALSDLSDTAAYLLLLPGTFCMWYIGEEIMDKKLKRGAVLLLLLPVLVWSGVSLAEKYCQISAFQSQTALSSGFSAKFSVWLLIATGIFTKICPSLCYLLVAFNRKLRPGAKRRDKK